MKRRVIGIELACLAIVVLWLALRMRAEPERRALLARLSCMAAASWIGEESCIRLYGFYSYASAWHARLLDVPLAIVCIWPIVVQSALDLTRGMSGKRRALWVAALVVVDASLIEPIATAAGLWTWFDPGPFSVPIVGVLGWGFFALGVAAVIERRAWLALLAGPATAHVLLLAAWWGALRWLPPGEDARPLVAVALLGSSVAAVRLVRRPPRVERRSVMLRAPAAGFFFVLLALFARDDGWLVGYALAFAPPWLVLLLVRAPASRGEEPLRRVPMHGRRRLALMTVGLTSVVVTALTGGYTNRTISFVEPPARTVAIDEPLADDERTLVLVGDVMLGRGVAAYAAEHGQQFSWFFDATKHLTATADVAFANLEAPISGRGSRRPGPLAFNAPAEAALGLTAAGFDVVSLANNHALDYGPVALADTRDNVERAGAHAVGVGPFDVPQTPVIVDARGVTIGFLGYCDPRSAGGCPILDGQLADKPYRALRRTLERDVRALRPRVDVLVVSLHWGIEERTQPSARQVELAHWLVELGVDVVAGHHPHVQQPAERYRRGVILYSMGNFVFDQHSLSAFMDSRIYRIVVTKEGVRRAAWLPTHYQKKEWQPRPVDDRLREIR